MQNTVSTISWELTQFVSHINSLREKSAVTNNRDKFFKHINDLSASTRAEVTESVSCSTSNLPIGYLLRSLSRQ